MADGRLHGVHRARAGVSQRVPHQPELRDPILDQGRLEPVLSDAGRRGEGRCRPGRIMSLSASARSAFAALCARRVPTGDRASAASRRHRPLPLVLRELRPLPARGDLRRRRLSRRPGLARLREFLRIRGIPDLQEVRHHHARAGEALSLACERRRLFTDRRRISAPAARGGRVFGSSGYR